MSDPNWTTTWISAIVVLVLLGLAVWLARKRQLPGRSGQGLYILKRLGLGQNRWLMVVRAGEKTLLMGVTSHTITCLAELSEKGWEQIVPAQPGSGGFSDLLQGLMHKKDLGAGGKFPSGRDRDEA